MPFQKGHKYAAMGGKASGEAKRNLWEFVASGGIRAYNDKLEKLRDGTALTKPEQEFMDRVEKLFPYIKARKTDVTTNDKELSALLIKFVDDKK